MSVKGEQIYDYYTGPLKRMDLVLRYNNFCKKKDIRIGCAVMCSSAHKIFLTLTCTDFYAYPNDMHDTLSAVAGILSATVSQYNGKRARESTVVWLAKIVKHANILKSSVFWGIMHDSITGPFFFAENVTVYIYVGMLQLFILSQTDGIEQEEEGEILFQQECAPPHFICEVQSALN